MAQTFHLNFKLYLFKIIHSNPTAFSRVSFSFHYLYLLFCLNLIQQEFIYFTGFDKVVVTGFSNKAQVLKKFH